MKRQRNGLTMIELLTVVGIIAILIGLLIPAVSMVRRIAKEAQQRAQITAIELAITAFKNDYGDYPPSGWQGTAVDYSGAQMLAEALVGWDLLGFHPKSAWRADGKDKNGGTDAYLGATTGTQAEKEKNLKERKGPYLEVATANAFKLNQLFSNTGSTLAPNTYVLCDVFGAKKVIYSGGKTVMAGTPILYYRADTSHKNLNDSSYDLRIYNVYDNFYLVDLKKMTNSTKSHPLGKDIKNLYDFIKDPKVTVVTGGWPYRPDSYILISAGPDGEYGTSDDICNF